MKLGLLNRFATEKYRWIALVVLAMGLAIVIIDNTILNVAIPYILRDLHTSIDAIQWVISGYALIIATLLITMGRLGDIFGRKKIYILGTILFATGSLMASFAGSAVTLFIGEALIEAIGAAMIFTSSLSLLVTEFKGKERAIAFGIWGSVAGASAALGPLLGGYLTTYYSWRWSLRINVVVALITIIGTIFIKEARGAGKKQFDWRGTLYSGVGLFSLVFGLIEGRRYGWWKPAEPLLIGDWIWPYPISVIPFVFLFAFLILVKFMVLEYLMERRGGAPILRPSLFKNRGFSLGLATLIIMSFGQFGLFFVLAIYFQNVLGLNAFKTGMVFLSLSISLFVFGPLSGFIASRIKPRWVVSTGMFVLALGIFWLRESISIQATGMSLAPALVVIGAGMGMCGAQLTNVILSSVPSEYSGEASAVNATVRQVGTSIGIAIIGVVLASSLNNNLQVNVKGDKNLSDLDKRKVLFVLNGVSLESGQRGAITTAPTDIQKTVKHDVNDAFVKGVKDALMVAIISAFVGAFLSLSIPSKIQTSVSKAGSVGSGSL